jgi:hypothetical protein
MTNVIYPESLAMVLAQILLDRSTPIESKTHSQMKNSAETTSPAYFKPSLQINDLQSSLMFRDILNLFEILRGNPPICPTQVGTCFIPYIYDLKPGVYPMIVFEVEDAPGAADQTECLFH